jgi:hypothetical protein
VLAFKGDTESLISAVFGNQQQASGVAAPMLSVYDIGFLRLPSSGQAPADILIRNWGDQNATYKVSFPTTRALASFDSQTLSGVSGQLIKEELVPDIPAANRVTNSISPLHYGNYGAISLKLVYLILGLILCFVTASGLIIWVKRKLNRSYDSHSFAHYRRIGRFIKGATIGLPIACASIFHLDKLYGGEESARMLSTGSMYFIVWISVIIFSYVKKHEQEVIRQLLIVLAMLCTSIPISNYISTGDAFWLQLKTLYSWVWVDLTCLFVGLIFGLLATFDFSEKSHKGSMPAIHS